MSIKKMLAALNHKCRYCKQPATYVSTAPLSERASKFYFYCDKHKTPNAVSLDERI